MADEGSSTSSEELDGTSERFDPLKALYTKRPNVDLSLERAPLYDNLHQFLSAQKRGDAVLPVGHNEEVARREQEKQKAREEAMKQLEEKNRQRFSEAQALTTVPRKQRVRRDVLSRCERAAGPLAALRDCMENRIRVKVVTRNAFGVRGQLFGLLEAFDKQWNMALSDVLEIWRRKAKVKRKVPPSMGEPCPTGSAARRAPVPAVTETPVGGHVVECTRHVPQLLVRGEHVVLVQLIERWRAKPTSKGPDEPSASLEAL